MAYKLTVSEAGPSCLDVLQGQRPTDESADFPEQVCNDFGGLDKVRQRLPRCVTRKSCERHFDCLLLRRLPRTINSFSWMPPPVLRGDVHVRAQESTVNTCSGARTLTIVHSATPSSPPRNEARTKHPMAQLFSSGVWTPSWRASFECGRHPSRESIAKMVRRCSLGAVCRVYDDDAGIVPRSHASLTELIPLVLTVCDALILTIAANISQVYISHSFDFQLLYCRQSRRLIPSPPPAPAWD